MYTILSPRIRTVPNLLVDSPFSISSASFNTKFICRSKLFKIPLNSLSPLSFMRTGEFKDLPNASSGLCTFTFCAFTLSPILYLQCWWDLYLNVTMIII